jgi:lipid-A-disaccharide synthase
MKYYLIAGEASGDLHASNLMRALREEDGGAEFRFYGGDLMQAVGGQLVRHYRDMAYMGFVPVLLHLRSILRNMRMCKQDILQWKPDVLILIDYPGFNLDIAKYIHRHSQIPIYYYISPKIWAWKEHRIKNIKRDVDALFSILPFEVDFYEKKHGYPVHYVGNPCVDAVHDFLASSPPQPQPFEPQRPYVALLAGSRKQEISDNLGIMLQAMTSFPDYDVVVAAAPGIAPAFYEPYLRQFPRLRLVSGQTYAVLRGAVAALVTSGTATLETAIFRVPQVVCYSMPLGWLMAILRRCLLKVRHISLVNLVGNKEIVTELVGAEMNVERLKAELGEILPGGRRRERMQADYEEMNRTLGGPGASRRAARQMVELLRARME